MHVAVVVAGADGVVVVLDRIVMLDVVALVTTDEVAGDEVVSNVVVNEVVERPPCRDVLASMLAMIPPALLEDVGTNAVLVEDRWMVDAPNMLATTPPMSLDVAVGAVPVPNTVVRLALKLTLAEGLPMLP